MSVCHRIRLLVFALFCVADVDAAQRTVLDERVKQKLTPAELQALLMANANLDLDDDDDDLDTLGLVQRKP